MTEIGLKFSTHVYKYLEAKASAQPGAAATPTNTHVPQPPIVSTVYSDVGSFGSFNIFIDIALLG